MSNLVVLLLFINYWILRNNRKCYTYLYMTEWVYAEEPCPI